MVNVDSRTRLIPYTIMPNISCEVVHDIIIIIFIALFVQPV